MASKRVRCSICGMQIMVPPYTHAAIQCSACQTPLVHPIDPLSQAHSSISHAANRFKDKLHTASNNIKMMVVAMNNSSGTGTSSFGYRPPAPRPSPSVIPVSSHGRKRALLCGVSYYGQGYRLNGTVNDVHCMRFFLTQKLGFPSDSVLVLTEEESDLSRIPTKNNIRKALQWLVQGCQTGDSLVFHYSGHGSQQPDFNGDEVDGYDETLWPVDHQYEGKISDDEINATIVRPLPRGAKLHAIIDACHSGTVLDLPFVCRMNRNGYYMWEDQGQLSGIYKGTSGGLAVSFSACDDHQTAVDTTALSGNTSTGALTYSFIQAAQNEPGLTYGRLLNAMRHIIHDIKTKLPLNGPVTSFMKRLFYPKLTQIQKNETAKESIPDKIPTIRSETIDKCHQALTRRVSLEEFGSIGSFNFALEAAIVIC